MLQHSFGGTIIFLSLHHFIAPALDLMSCLQAWGVKDCNKDIKFNKGAFNCCNERKNYCPNTNVCCLFFLQLQVLLENLQVLRETIQVLLENI